MKLALSLPWQGGPTQINNTPMDTSKFADSSGQVTLGSALTQFTDVALYAGAFMMFFWAAWGVFDYIRAEGNKEALAKARKRIQWAIVGFIVLIFAFFISDVARSLLVGTRGTQRPLPILQY